MKAENWAAEQVRFLFCAFFPGVGWGRKNSGLCCEARVPSFDLEECASPEKKWRGRLALLSAVTRG